MSSRNSPTGMVVRTRIFELRNGKSKNLSMLAQAMGISVSQIYRVQRGERNINQKFIVGALQAFSNYKFDDLFYLSPLTETNSLRQNSSNKQQRQKKSDQQIRPCKNALVSGVSAPRLPLPPQNYEAHE